MIEGRVERRWEGLAAGNESPASSPAVAVVLLVATLVLDDLLHNLLDIPDIDEDILGFQICVDDAAFTVEIVEAKQDLLRDLLDQRCRDPAVVPLLDKSQEVLAKNLEYHADVCAVRSFVLEGVEETDDVLATGVIRLSLHDLVEELDLVDSGLGVVSGRSNDL